MNIIVFFLFFIASFLAGSCRTEVLVPLVPSDAYTHFEEIDSNNKEWYQLYWKRIGDDGIQFEAHVRTRGWFGLGFSPNGGMAGSDIAIAWVDSSGRVFLKDCHSVGKSAPIVDERQDLTLLDGIQHDNYTIVKWRRKLRSCDKQNDRDIYVGSNYMIFASNNEDPVTGMQDWKYHGTNRIPRVIDLLSFKSDSIDKQGILPADTFIQTFRMKNLKVPAKSTYYYCDLFEVPKFDSKAHMIQFEMIVNPKNVKNVHHLLIYECYASFTPREKLARECGNVGIPGDFAHNCMSRLIIAWGIGGQYNYSFPKEAGYAFEPTGKTNYFLFEMHYDNPELRSDIVDDSGIKLYFTQKELRPNDLGLIILGADPGIPLTLQIPPNAESFEYTSFCYPQCMDKVIPDEGIYAVSGLLHTHLAGRAVRTSLVRKDVLIEHLLDNQNYDFNYQFIQDIQPTKLYKGDALITTCKYNSKERSKFTYFGFSTYDEMCFDFLYYYPKIVKLEKCASNPNVNALYNFYRSLVKDKLIPDQKFTEETYPYDGGYHLKAYFDKVKATPELAQRFTDFFKSPHRRDFFCGGEDDYLVVMNATSYTPKEINLNTPELICDKEDLFG